MYQAAIDIITCDLNANKLASQAIPKSVEATHKPLATELILL